MQPTDLPPERPARGPSLIPALGLFSTTMFVVGAVIGSGIFVKPGLMASQLGSPGWLLAVWVIAGVITLIGALVNAEIAAMIPEAGGQYVFFDRMYGSFPAYLYGWSVFAVLKTGALASLAYIFSRGVSQFVELPSLPSALAEWSFHLPIIGDILPLADFGSKVLSAFLIIILTAVNYVGVRLGSVVQNVFAIAKSSALILVIFVGIYTWARGTAAPGVVPAAASADPVGMVGQLQGMMLIVALAAAIQGAFWAYDGWNDVTYLAGEIKDPQRNLPRGLIRGMLIVMGIYCMANVAYLLVLPIEEMAGNKLVAAEVVERCFTGGGKWIAVAVIISTFGAANGNVLAPARVFMAMARHRVFPAVVGRIHPRFHTPAAALVLQAVWAIVLVFSGTFDSLTNTLVFVNWIFYGAGAVGVFVLRRKEPNTPRPYRVPGYPVLPWVFIVFAAVFLVLTIYNDTTQYYAALAAGKPAFNNSALGLCLVLLGSPIYFYCRRNAQREAGTD